jgi:hypothetical protein
LFVVGSFPSKKHSGPAHFCARLAILEPVCAAALHNREWNPEDEDGSPWLPPRMGRRITHCIDQQNEQVQ